MFKSWPYGVVSLEKKFHFMPALSTQNSVIQRLNSSIQWVNHYSLDKYSQNLLSELVVIFQ